MIHGWFWVAVGILTLGGAVEAAIKGNTKMMLVYIAGSYSGRHRIRAEAAKLPASYNILSRWFNDDDFIEKAWDNDFAGRVAESMAMGDAYAILEADLLILDTIDKSSTGGSDTELGLALALRLRTGKPRIVHIGPHRNIFQTLVREHYPTWEAYLEHESQKI